MQIIVPFELVLVLLILEAKDFIGGGRVHSGKEFILPRATISTEVRKILREKQGFVSYDGLRQPQTFKGEHEPRFIYSLRCYLLAQQNLGRLRSQRIPL